MATLPFPTRTRRYQRVRRGFTPRSMLVSSDPPPIDAPGIGQDGRVPAVGFVPDGMIYPKPNVTFFDATVRVASLTPSDTVIRTVFTQEERIKGGWIRYLGYEFNNPHGFFQVRTTLLINGGTPSNYIFKTVDAAGEYQGSFPTSQIGTIENPTSVFIFLPSNSLVEVRFVNNNANEAFSGTVRLVGWSFA